MLGRRCFTLAAFVLLLAASAPAVAEDGTFPLTVRDGDTGRPIAGATVHVLVRSTLVAEKLFTHFEERDVQTLARLHGEALLTDEKGVAAVPREALESGWCVVTHEGRFGATSFYDPDLEETHEVEIFPDAAVRVRVVGPGGEPVGGVPVSLRRATDDMYPFLWRGNSAAETGEVAIRHLPWRYRRAAQTAGLAGIEIPGVAVVAKIAWPRESREPVVLRLPATGSLRVAPTGDGAGGRLRLTLREDPLERWAPAIEKDVTEREAVVFPHVGLGKRYRVDMFPFDRVFRQPEPFVCDGPVEAGQEATAAPVVDGRNVLLVGRIVDEEGKPVVDREFHAWLHLGEGFNLSGVHTDAQGRFQYVVDLFLGGPVMPPAEVVLELVPQAQSMSGDSRVRVALQPPLKEGVNDLGDLVLPTMPTVLSGVVVDGEGNPVPEVYVFVSQGRPLTAEEAGQRWHNPRPVASDEQDEDPTWAWSPQLRGISDAEGRFVVRGELLENQPCRFAIHRTDYVMRAPQIARPGATDERLVLEKTGRLAGAIRLGRELDPKWLHLHLRGRPAARDALSPGMWGSREPPPDHVGEIVNSPGWQVLGQVTVPARDGLQPFVFSQLRPGVATLSVCIGDDPDPIAEFSGIEIGEGTAVRDPRFDPLDASGLVRTIALRIEDASGTLPAGLEVRVFRGHDRQTANLVHPTVPPPGGTALTRLTVGVASRVDVDVRAPGRRAVRLFDVQEDQRIRLKAGIPIRVALPPDWREETGPKVSCQAYPVHDPQKRFFHFRTDGVSALREGDSSQFPVLRLPTAGPWLLTLHRGAEELARRTITVRDDASEEQVFSFE